MSVFLRRVATASTIVVVALVASVMPAWASAGHRNEVSASRAVGAASALADFTTGADRIITVRSANRGSTTAELNAWQRVGNHWLRVMGPWTANLGANGWSPASGRLEGDGTTPVGSFSFGVGFGLAGNPGYQLGWFNVGPYDYWTADPSRADYNMHQLGPANPALAPWNGFEHLIDHPDAYRYAASINFNVPATGPYGSAIFLHVSTGGPTAGCVSIPQTQLLQLLPWIDQSTRIVMGPDSDIASSLPPEIRFPNGTIVSNSGRYAVMAGGAAISVTSWAAIGRGGPPSGTLAVTDADWSSLSGAKPVDSTRLYTLAGPGYVVAGGAATYVAGWANVGGSGDAVLVDPAGLSQLNSVPVNSTRLYTLAGPGYVVAGGAATYVAGWANVGGSGDAVLVDPAGLSQLNSVPVNSTRLYTLAGPGYVVAGGAATYVAGWANVGGSGDAVLVDPAGLAQLNPRPVDGTKLYVIQGSGFFMAAGFAHYVAAWSDVGGSSGAVLIDAINLVGLMKPLP